MTQEEYFSIDWKRGNMVKLTNGKEYMVRAVKSKCLLLHSEEFYSLFVADYRIIDSRTSDAVEQKKEEVQPEQYVPRPQQRRPQQYRHQGQQYGRGYRNNQYGNNQYGGSRPYRNNSYRDNSFGDNGRNEDNGRRGDGQYGARQYNGRQYGNNGYGNRQYGNRYEQRWNNNSMPVSDGNGEDARNMATGYNAGPAQNAAPVYSASPAAAQPQTPAFDSTDNAVDMQNEQAPAKRKRQRVVIRKTTVEKVEYRPRNYNNPDNAPESTPEA